MFAVGSDGQRAGTQIAASEPVGQFDLQSQLGAQGRLLATGATNKNDPNDARSVAVAALRWTTLRPVRTADHSAIMKLWAKRHHDLGRTRTEWTTPIQDVARDEADATRLRHPEGPLIEESTACS